MFRLPAYQELSKEQDAVYNLPVGGHHLVIGPPGTGKTVIALYRAEMLKTAGKTCMFVVFNNTLNQYLETAIQEKGLESCSTTFHRWFPKWYKTNFGTKPPELERWHYDWTTIYQEIGKKGTFTRFPNLILDEGQDFPREMFRVLRLLVENCTVFADENQRICDSNSTVEDIRKSLGIAKAHTLHRNYRNSLPIAKFAQCFYTGLESGIPDLPERNGPPPKLIRASHDGQTKLITYYANNNQSRSIGVMVYYKEQMKKLYSELIKTAKVPVQMYYSDLKEHRSIDFTQNGIILTTYASAKGLEFDTVFLPQLEEIRTDSKIDEIQMKLYVLVSRARDELYLLSDSENPPYFLEKIPSELYTRERLKEK